MSAGLNTVPARDVRRRGTAAIEENLRRGPVHVLRRNRPVFVALSEEAFAELVTEADRNRKAASLADIREGRVRSGTAAGILAELSR